MRLVGKVALVTGAGGGLGSQIALGFAREAAEVVVNYYASMERANNVVNEIESLGRRSMAIKADVSNSREVDEMVKVVLEKFGKIDILVNNAGILSGMTPVVDMKEKDWERVIAVNLKGTFLCSKAVARQMIKQKSGKIINISALGARTGIAGAAHYSASKGGIISFTKTLSQELSSYNINVNAICPGAFYAGLLKKFAERDPAGWRKYKEGWLRICPMGRLGRPEEIVGIAIFLASDEASFITGQAINVCGGVGY